MSLSSSAVPELSYPIPIVMNVSGANGLGVIQSLAEHGLRSLALDHQPDAIGFASRYAVGLNCPDPQVAPDRFISFLVALGQKMPQKGVLLMTHDTYLAEVAKGASELSSYFYFTAPPWPVLQRVMDKKVQCQTAQAMGVAVPRTFFLSDTPPDQLDPSTLAWPAILKAQFGKSFSRAVGRQVIVVNSMQDVRACYATFGQFDLMLQEIIPGEDDQLYTFGSCLGRSGEVLAAFTGRKLRQHPASFGTALVAESVRKPGLAEQSMRLLRALGFFGPSQVEFKLDSRDGRFKLVEINARFWKWHSLATACGANVAYAAYCDAIGDAASPRVAGERRKTWAMCLDDFIITGRRVLRGAYPWRSLCKTYASPFVDGVFSCRDPLPGARFLWHTIGLGWSRLLQRLRTLSRKPLGRNQGTTTAGNDAVAEPEAAASGKSIKDADRQ